MAEAVRQLHISRDGTKQPKQAQLEAKLLVVAVCVRLAYLALVAAFWRLLDDYDTSASLLSDSCADSWPEEAASAQQYLPGVVWDSIFFHRIAACGYEYEQFFAFYPGLPGVVRLIRSTGLLQGPYGFAITALVLNNACFLLSVWLLTKLGQKLIQDDKVVATAVLIFIASPASIHHSMLYTEALFTVTSWLGLYCLYCLKSSLAASLAFAASSAVRSNGLLNAGFILHEHGRHVLSDLHHRKWVTAARQVATAVLCTAICAVPYFAYMLFSYKEFCTGVYGEAGPYQQRPWCTQTIPSAYGYVQRVYWHVGFLKYYKSNQIPNFILAGPTLVMSLWGALAYAAANPHVFLTGGLLPVQLLQQCFGGRPLQRSASSGSCGPGDASSGSEDSKGQREGRLQACSRLLGCIIGWNVYCSGADAEEDVDAAAAVKSPAIPGVAFQSLRLRQQEVLEQKQQLLLQQEQQQLAGRDSQGRPQSNGTVAKAYTAATAANWSLHQRQRPMQMLAGVGMQRTSSLESAYHRQPPQQQVLQQQQQQQGLLRQGSDGATIEYRRHRMAAAAASSRSRSSSRPRAAKARSTSRPSKPRLSGCSCAGHTAYYRPELAVFVIHWLLLTLVCLAVVHIQVSTRLLSSCAPLYWFAALLMLHKGPVLRWLLWWYCFAYMGVGAVMFINFYPWV